MSGADWRRACCCAQSDICADCADASAGATSDGGKTPFSWADVCTWMVDAVYGAPSFELDASYCRWIYPMDTVNGGTANPQGVLIYLTYNRGAQTWDVEAYAATTDLIYSVYGLPKATFACAGGELSGTATLAADYCVGDPDATFTI